jgi:hypothetical protein
VLLVRATRPPGPRAEDVEFLEGLDIRDPEFENWTRDQRLARAGADPASVRGFGYDGTRVEGEWAPPASAWMGPPSVAVLGMSEAPDQALAQCVSGFVRI